MEDDDMEAGISMGSDAMNSTSCTIIKPISTTTSVLRTLKLSPFEKYWCDSTLDLGGMRDHNMCGGSSNKVTLTHPLVQ